MGDNLLWYRQPACDWRQALPLGNGRLGAMVHGGVDAEVIDLSECTFVSGEASPDNSQPGAPEAYRQARQALLAGDYAAGNRAADGCTGRKLNYGTNLPVGRLEIAFDDAGDEPAEEYMRSLDLAQGLCSVRYARGGAAHRREVLVSHPHQVLAIRLQGERLCFTARIRSDCPCAVAVDGDLTADVLARESIHSDGETGVRLRLQLRVLAQDGHVYADGDGLQVQSAGSAVLLLAMNTDFVSPQALGLCGGQLDAAQSLGWERLLAAHTADVAALLDRAALDLGAGPDLPTDRRLDAVKQGAQDPALAALMFQYGRYLLLSSSRHDSPLPAHLQGGWNDGIACRIGWTCDMHLDINTQMNHWPALATGLAECALPLHRWVTDTLTPSGRETARQTYGLPGWVAHTVSNAWGYSAPGWDTYWGFHPTGGVWIASHLWEQYLFTGDRALLAAALPVFREAVVFFTAYLAEDPQTGYLLPAPSYSPENAFRAGGAAYPLCAAATCDVLMIRELFSIYCQACAALKSEDELAAQAKDMALRLPPYRMGRHGQLQEWLQDFEEAVPNHRHTSHLLGVFPFAQVTPDGTPELAAAARRTIERRLKSDAGWEDTGWARSLLLLYAARLRDGAWAGEHVLSMQRSLTNDNLMVFHPAVAGSPGNVYELDGNTGLTSGIAEALLQSHGGALHLLPALPPQWPRGAVRGLRGRGGFTVDMRWEAGVLTQARITSAAGGGLTVRYRDLVQTFELAAGESMLLDGGLERAAQFM